MTGSTSACRPANPFMLANGGTVEDMCTRIVSRGGGPLMACVCEDGGKDKKRSPVSVLVLFPG